MLKFILAPFGSCSQPKTRLSVPASSKTTYAPSLQSTILHTYIGESQVWRGVLIRWCIFCAVKPSIHYTKNYTFAKSAVKSVVNHPIYYTNFALVHLPRESTPHRYNTVMHGSPIESKPSEPGRSSNPSCEMMSGSVTSTHLPSISIKERPGAVFAS